MKQCRLPIVQKPTSYFSFQVARQALARLTQLARSPEPKTLAVIFDGPKAGKTCFLKQAFLTLAETNLLSKCSLIEINKDTSIGSFINTFDSLKRKNRSILVALDDTIEDKAVLTRVYDSENIHFIVTEEELKDYVEFFSRSCFFKITASSFRRIYLFLDRKLSVWNQFLMSLASHRREPKDLKKLVSKF